MPESDKCYGGETKEGRNAGSTWKGRGFSFCIVAEDLRDVPRFCTGLCRQRSSKSKPSKPGPSRYPGRGRGSPCFWQGVSQGGQGKQRKPEMITSVFFSGRNQGRGDCFCLSTRFNFHEGILGFPFATVEST